MFIIYLLCLIIFISVLVDILLDIHLIIKFKNGVRLSGKIVKVCYSIDGRRKVGRPHVSVKIHGKEHIFAAIVFFNDYKINDNVIVYYNNKVFSNFVLIYKNRFISIILAMLVFVVGILFLLQYLHFSLLEELGSLYDENEIIFMTVIILFSCIIATLIAKLFYKNKYSIKPTDIIIENPINDKEFNKYSNIEIGLYKNRMAKESDNKIIQDAIKAIDNIKDKNSDMYLNLNVGVFDSYIKNKQYDLAYKLIDSINILDIYKTARFDKSDILKWVSIIELLDRKMKIYKIVNDIEKVKNLVLEGKTIMKRAEKYIIKYNPETRRNIDIKKFYYECCLFSKDYKGAKEQAQAMSEMAYYKQEHLILADLLLAEVSKIQGDMQEFKMRMDNAESIVRNENDRSENKLWFEEYKKKLGY